MQKFEKQREVNDYNCRGAETPATLLLRYYKFNAAIVSVAHKFGYDCF